ncbi:hypothetical protein [Pseudonocardia sp.]|jgi:hypothetical protein|uniref:hypothetical protein n=1 Tax=Pseudonocardia sp. TaxID=60912 RepID=UPI002608E691|nr:hypothetical protein [Pseudonocardia sp.]MCW2720189.1 hypothetical protein [Pseudonocardia sp.]MDT7612735.1 hypothetical protein [Pseudonocardiales bacterium]
MDIAQRSRTGSHARVGDRVGWGPTPRSGRSYSSADRRDGKALTALRVVTYVLVSLASLVFIASAVYAGVAVYRLHGAVGQFTSAVVGVGSAPPLVGEGSAGS